MEEMTVSAHPAPFECSPTLGKLAAALAKAQGEFPVAEQSGTGKVGKIGSQRSYKYSTLADMVAATRAPLAKHGLAVVQLPTLDSPGWAIVRTTLVHESGEWIAGAVAVPSTAEFGAAAHVIGSAISYARRYGYGSLLAIVTEDDDGSAAQDHAQERAQQQRAPESRGDAAATNGKVADWKTRAIAKLKQLFPSAEGAAAVQLAIASAVLGKPVETFQGWEDGRHWRAYMERLEKLSKADVNRIASDAFASAVSEAPANTGALALDDEGDPFNDNHPAQREPSAMAQGA